MPQDLPLGVLLLAGATLFGLVLFLAIVARAEQARMERIAERRSQEGDDWEVFWQDLAGTGLAREAARAVFDVIREERRLPHNFPVRAGDLLVAFYGFRGDDLDDLIASALDRAGREWPPADVCRESRLATVFDLVECVSKAPRKLSDESTSAAGR